MKKYLRPVSFMAVLGTAVIQANADMALAEGLVVKPSIDVTYGMFYSDKSYNNPDADEQNYWHEV